MDSGVEIALKALGQWELSDEYRSGQRPIHSDPRWVKESDSTAAGRYREAGPERASNTINQRVIPRALCQVDFTVCGALRTHIICWPTPSLCMRRCPASAAAGLPRHYQV
jgi:hypothetical protein